MLLQATFDDVLIHFMQFACHHLTPTHPLKSHIEKAGISVYQCQGNVEYTFHHDLYAVCLAHWTWKVHVHVMCIGRVCVGFGGGEGGPGVLSPGKNIPSWGLRVAGSVVQYPAF